MIKSTLTVNLDPPYLAFEMIANVVKIHRDCTEEEILEVLIELGGKVFKWPLMDCIIRSRGQFTNEMLLKFQLLPVENIDLGVAS